jgi:hypothetical protein
MCYSIWTAQGCTYSHFFNHLMQSIRLLSASRAHHLPEIYFDSMATALSRRPLDLDLEHGMLAAAAGWEMQRETTSHEVRIAFLMAG